MTWEGVRRRLLSGAWTLACIVGFATPVAAAPSDDATFVESRRVHPVGLTLLQPHRRRTPTGFLYPYPFAPPETQPLAGDWTFRPSCAHAHQQHEQTEGQSHAKSGRKQGNRERLGRLGVEQMVG